MGRFLGWTMAAALVLGSTVLLDRVASAQEAAIADVYGKGIHAYFARNYADAHGYFTQAIQAGTQDARAYYFRGLCSMQLGRQPDAEQDFAQGTKLEVAGLEQFGEISRSLERVQGNARRTLENYRSNARMAVVAEREKMRVQRYEVARAQPGAGAPAAGEAAPAGAAPAQAGENPFGAPAKPAGDNPFAPAAPAATEKPAAEMPAKAGNPFAASPTPEAPAKPAAPATPPATAPATPPANPDQATAAITLPDTPDGTVTTIINETANGRPQVIWQALPAKYQADVKGLLAEFGGKMDQELWDKVFGMLGKTVTLAKDKKDLILNYPGLANAPGKDSIAENWDKTVAFLELLAVNELSTLDGVKMLDPDAFLSGTVAKLFKMVEEADATSPMPQMAAMKEMAKQIKVTVVSSEGDTATLSIEMPGQEAKEEMYKRVDGKWLPAAMVDTWDMNVEMAKASLGMLDFEMIKPQVMPVLTTVEGAIDGLLKLETQEEFNTAIDGVMALLGPVLQQFMPMPPGAAAPPANNM